MTRLKPLTIWIKTNCGIFLEKGIPDHLTCLLRNLYEGQEATVRTGHVTVDWFQTGKGTHYIVTLLIYLLGRVLCAICQTDWVTSWNQDCWDKYQQPQICRWHHSNGIKWRETKEPLEEGERGEWKSWLKLNIQTTKIIASSPVTLMANRRGKSGNSDRFYFPGLKNYCDGYCSHEIKRYLLLERKAMINLVY